MISRLCSFKPTRSAWPVDGRMRHGPADGDADPRPADDLLECGLVAQHRPGDRHGRLHLQGVVEAHRAGQVDLHVVPHVDGQAALGHASVGDLDFHRLVEPEARFSPLPVSVSSCLASVPGPYTTSWKVIVPSTFGWRSPPPQSGNLRAIEVDRDEPAHLGRLVQDGGDVREHPGRDLVVDLGLLDRGAGRHPERRPLRIVQLEFGFELDLPAIQGRRDGHDLDAAPPHFRTIGVGPTSIPNAIDAVRSTPSSASSPFRMAAVEPPDNGPRTWKGRG